MLNDCFYFINSDNNFTKRINGLLNSIVSGLQAELYYVREGVINMYAMKFVVKIPANVTDLEFSWQSLVKHPVSTY